MDEAPILTRFEIKGEEVIFSARPPNLVSTLEIVILAVLTGVCAVFGTVGVKDFAVLSIGQYLCLVCGALTGATLAFRLSLWLIQRRARYELRLNLYSGLVTLLDIRGFDPARRATFSAEQVGAITLRQAMFSAAQVGAITLIEGRMTLTWADESEPAIAGKFVYDLQTWAYLDAVLRANEFFGSKIE